MRISSYTTIPLLALAAIVAHAGPASAVDETVEAFYRNRQVTLIVGSSAGGGYDAYSRLLARHIGRHIPGNPSIVVQNMPGASGVRSINYLANIAPKDGSVFGIGTRSTLVEPLFGSDQVKADARKLSWIGGLNTEWSVGVSWRTSGLTSIADARAREFAVSSSGISSDGAVYAAILNNVLGTRFRIINGYPGTAEEQLAMQRGEVAGRVGWAWGSLRSTARDHIEKGDLKPFVLLSPQAQPGIDAPLARDFAASDEDRAVLDFAFAPQLIGRPFFGPPDVPADRLAVLRTAFAETTQDAAFLEEADRLQLEISYVSAHDLQELANRLYATPARIIERTKQARQASGF
ncbi:MAG: family tricarboxylate transporter, receptor protein [Hyphomicrobiales bacterium]|nr:family tricarboxylate transporter, receptor protein [Hyphomicrobiales bacterium]